MAYAYTKKYDKKASAMVSRITIKNTDTGQSTEVNALWDTGAVRSCITKRVYEELNLQLVSIEEMTSASGKTQAGIYYAMFSLPNGYVIGVPAYGLEKPVGKYHAIIGMDIISKGDFAISNLDDRTTFTFRIPSAGVIDFEKEKGTAKTKKSGSVKKG